MTQGSVDPDAEKGDSQLERMERAMTTLLTGMEIQNRQFHKQEQLLSMILERFGNTDDRYLSGDLTTVGKASTVITAAADSDDCDLEVDVDEGEIDLDEGQCADTRVNVETLAGSTNGCPESFRGSWIDKTGSFFGGCPIEIDAYGWRPVNSRVDAYVETAAFTINCICETRIELVETREDNTVRTFIVSLSKQEEDASAFLDVFFSNGNAQLTWRLSAWGSHRSNVAECLESRVGPTKSESAPLESCNAAHMRWAAYSRTFELVMAVIILINSVCIGLQIHYEVGPQGVASPASVPAALKILEHVFLSIYVTELLINLCCKGVRKCFADKWFLFDSVVVFTGTMSLWVLEPIQTLSNAQSEAPALDQVIMLRLLRLVRLLRAVRGLRQVRTAWRMTVGMMNSAGTVVSTLALLAFLLYIFACVGIEVITKDQTLWAAQPEIMQNGFNNLETTIGTLFQFVTLDSVAALYMPLIKAKPVLIFYFLTVAMCVSIVLMNLVTAVIVERALESANVDREHARRKARKELHRLRPVIENLYDDLDSGGKGYIGMADLDGMYIGDLPKEIQPHVKVGHMGDLFQLLDVDALGKVDKVEFVEGLLGMAVDYSGKASIETALSTKILHVVSNMEVTLNAIKHHGACPPAHTVSSLKG